MNTIHKKENCGSVTEIGLKMGVAFSIKQVVRFSFNEKTGLKRKLGGEKVRKVDIVIREWLSKISEEVLSLNVKAEVRVCL